MQEEAVVGRIEALGGAAMLADAHLADATRRSIMCMPPPPP